MQIVIKNSFLVEKTIRANVRVSVKAFVTIILVLVSMQSFADIVLEDNKAGNVTEDSWYLGGGIGLSRLKPDAREAQEANPDIALKDNGDQAFQVFAGFELSRYWAVEVVYASLGGIDVEDDGEPAGRIEYDRFVGANGVYHWYVPDYLDWSIYGKAGLGTLSFNGVGAVDVDERKSSQIYIGGGIEKRFVSKWAARFDLMSIDTDVKYLTLSVLKRYGITATARAIADTFLITEHKEHFDTEIFYYDESVWELTKQQKERLEDIASEFTIGGANRIEISAYSDALGTEQYNYWISSIRAKEVFRYLRFLGVPELELEVNAVNSTDAQWEAVENDKSKEAFSRRVELKILRKNDYEF